MAKLRTCKICGKQYEYCGHCPSKNLIEPWRNLYCSEKCRDAFGVMGDYVAGKMTAVVAREKLESFDIKPGIVREVHKGVVADIFRAGKPSVKVEPTMNIDIPMLQHLDVTEEKESSSTVLQESVVKEKPFKKKKNFEKRENIIVNED